jgi:hypothetical protein
MSNRLLRAVVLGVVASALVAAPAAADAPAASPFSFSFDFVDPCTGDDMTVTFSGTTYRHDHAERATYHADVTVTTSSGYEGHGIEASVDHERIFIINHVIASPDGRRYGAHLVTVIDQQGTLSVDRALIECIGASAH